MATMIAALPAMHLVCNIVISETPRLNSNLNFASNQSLLKTLPSPVPNGYIVYPEINAAYKVAEETVTWHVAKERCASDNAHLAVIDSVLKLQLVRNQSSLIDRAHVGLYLMEGNNEWLSAKTGLPVSHIPWTANEPSGAGSCALIRPISSGNGLGKYPCTDLAKYVCEFPIP